VFLDWRFLGSAPVTLPDAAAGSHAVKVLSADKAWVGEVVVAPGESKRLEVAPDRPILESLPGGKLLNHRDGTTLVRIPKGAFIAGSATGRPEERPLRRVEVDDFFIGLCEITNGQYASFLGATGRARQLREMERTVLPGKVDHPVVNVSWPEAESYCRWAGMRLPTEPEWEKAARGTDGRAYPWGDTWDRDRCNNWQLHSHGGKPVESASFGGIGTTPVGTFPAGASAWGCLDMAGNVWEWTADLFRVPADIETETPASHRVVKGGSWYLSTAEETRCAARYGFDPGNRYLNLGFRTAISRP